MASKYMWQADWFKVSEEQLRSLEVDTPAIDDALAKESLTVLRGPFYVERKGRSVLAMNLEVQPAENVVTYYDGWGIVDSIKGRVTFQNDKITYTTTTGAEVKIRKATDADAEQIGGTTVADIIEFYKPDPALGEEDEE